MNDWSFFKSLSKALTFEETIEKAAQKGGISDLDNLFKHRLYLDNQEAFLTLAFHAAISTAELETAKYLLDQGATLDCLWHGRTPLITAIIKNQYYAVYWLLKHDLSKTLLIQPDFYGHTPLHHAIYSECSFMIYDLLLETGGKELLQIKNIYGQTSLDLENINPTEQPISIDQDNIESNLTAFFALHKKDIVFLKDFEEAEPSGPEKKVEPPKEGEQLESPGVGLCTGLAFLFLYYGRQGKRQYFFDTLQMIVDWDGTEETLYQELSNTLPQREFYKNLNELMACWSNDIIAFQKGISSENLESQATWWDQTKRSEQYNIMRADRQSDLIYLYQARLDDPQFKMHASVSQIKQLLDIVKTMPEKTCAELYGGGHTVCFYVDQAGQFQYYDPLLEGTIPLIKEPDHLLKLMIDTKYKARELAPSDPSGFFYQLFYFSEDESYFKDFDVEGLQAKLEQIAQSEIESDEEVRFDNRFE